MFGYGRLYLRISVEDGDDLLIRDLIKGLVGLADGVEVFRGIEADDLILFGLQFTDGGGGGDGDGYHDSSPGKAQNHRFCILLKIN